MKNCLLSAWYLSLVRCRERTLPLDGGKRRLDGNRTSAIGGLGGSSHVIELRYPIDEFGVWMESLVRGR
jgi:hypothetical protein